MALLKLRRTPKKKLGVIGRIKNKSWGQSRSYLFEYGFMLLLVGVLNVLLITMFRAIIDATNAGVDARVGSYGQSVVVLSSVLVVLPLLILLIQRTAASQRVNPAIKNTAWRKAFLGIFLASTSIAALIMSIIFVNSLVSPLANLSLGTSQFDWRASLSGFFAAAVLVLTAWVFAEDYRYLKKGHSARLRHVYRYAMVITTLVIAAVFIVWPMCEQRKAQVDEAIVGDITTMQAMVMEYEQKNAQLPEKISDLKLEGLAGKRADKYDYTYDRSSESKSKYTLCAVFKTDASNRTRDFGIPRPLPALLSTPVQVEPAIYPDYGGERDPSNHKQGRDCFDFSTKYDIQPAFDGSESSDPFRNEIAPDMPQAMPMPIFEQ